MALGAPLALALADGSVPSPPEPHAASNSPAAAIALAVIILRMSVPHPPCPARSFRAPGRIMPRGVGDWPECRAGALPLCRIAGVAQLAAHLSCKQGVPGSSPGVGSVLSQVRQQLGGPDLPLRGGDW